MNTITVDELAARRECGDAPYLLDVREPAEYACGAIDGSINIPLRDVKRRLREIPRDRDVVVICHSGARSAMMTRMLNGLGYERAVNLRGGMAAYASQTRSGRDGEPSLSRILRSMFGR